MKRPGCHPPTRRSARGTKKVADSLVQLTLHLWDCHKGSLCETTEAEMDALRILEEEVRHATPEPKE